MWLPKPPTSKFFRHYDPYLVYSCFNGPHHHHTAHGVRFHLLGQYILSQNTVIFLSLSLLWSLPWGINVKSVPSLTQKFYKAAHLEGAQSTIWNKVLEKKIKNGQFKRAIKKCAHAHTPWGLTHFDHSALTLNPMVVSQDQGALPAGAVRAETSRTIYSAMIAVLCLSVVTLEVANIREKLIKLHGVHFKIWGYMEPNRFAFFFFFNEKEALV